MESRTILELEFEGIQDQKKMQIQKHGRGEGKKRQKRIEELRKMHLKSL